MGRIFFSRKRKIVTESRLAICQIRDNFAEKESRNPKDDTEAKTSGFSKKKKSYWTMAWAKIKRSKA